MTSRVILAILLVTGVSVIGSPVHGQSQTLGRSLGGDRGAVPRRVAIAETARTSGILPGVVRALLTRYDLPD
jgi:hypothetical protein